MRIPVCWAIVMLLASAAAAQDGLRSASLPERTPQNPVPPPSLDIYRVPPTHWTTPRVPHRPGAPHYPVYGAPIYPIYGPYLAAPEPARDRSRFDWRGAENGYLHLQMHPAHAQVYVDGFYMGSVDDFRRLIPGRSLEAGAHRVELRAPGYEARTFDVMIAPNETITYRADLRPEAAPVPTVVLPPARPKTFYVIPGCYAGDKPPAGRLPHGCNRSKTRVVPPPPATSAQR